MKPRVFIGSSTEGRTVAYAVQQNLVRHAEPTVWDQGVFDLSSTTIESLIAQLDRADFAVFVFNPDDIVKIRKVEQVAVRDNVLFELGLFIGRLGRERVFFIMPSGADLRLPTDLLGVTAGRFEADRTDGSMQAATAPVVHQIATQIQRMGPVLAEKIQPDTPVNDQLEPDTSQWLVDFVNKRYDDAEAKLKVALGKATDDARPRLLSWLAYGEHKRAPQSNAVRLTRLFEESDGQIETKAYAARFLLTEGYPSEVLRLINGLNDSEKASPKVLPILADCLLELGQPQAAVAALRLNDLDPENSEIAVKLSEVYQNLGDLQAAFRVLHNALTRLPKDESLQYKAARVAAELKYNKIALYLLTSLTLRFPGHAEYWGYLGNACLALDLYDSALKAYRTAHDLAEGKQEWITSNIGNLFANKGLPTEAVTYLKRAIDLDGDSQYAHDRLAKALNSAKETAQQLQAACDEGRTALREWTLPVQTTTKGMTGVNALLAAFQTNMQQG